MTNPFRNGKTIIIAALLFLAVPAFSLYAAESDEIDLSGFEFSDDFELKSDRTDDKTDDRNTADEKSERSNLQPFRIITAVSYWYPADEEWSGVLTPVIAARAAVGFPEAGSGIFGFSAEPGVCYRLSFGKGERKLNLNAVSARLPLVFSFSLSDRMRLCLAAAFYYEHCFLEYQEMYRKTAVYQQDQFGISAELRYTCSVASFLNVGISAEYDIPLTKGVYSDVKAGIILEWRLG